MAIQIVCLCGPLDPEILRQGLFRLQARHPQLQSTISDAGRYFGFCNEPYRQSTPEQRYGAVPLEVVPRNGDDSWMGATEQELSRDFLKDSHCLWRVVLLYGGVGDACHELIMVFHHAISDGVSTTRFAHELFLFCGGGVDDDADCLSGSLPASLPWTQPIEQRIPRQDADGSAGSGDQQKNEVGNLPYEVKAPLAGRKARRLFRRIDPQVMAGLKSGCKKNHMTLNGALTAAILLAAADMQNAAEHIACTSAVNLRTYSQPAVSDDHFGCFIMMLDTVHALKGHLSFWDLAANCGRELKREISLKKSQGFLPSQFHKAFLGGAMHNRIAGAAARSQFAAGPAFSNVGRPVFAESYGPLQLRGIYCTAPQVSGLYPFFLCVISLHGTLHCCYSYAEPLISSIRITALANAFECNLQAAAKTQT
ncbi:MAG: hypothetical protein GY868_01915 [Deltaproteobacteria bacterium]|nr:hypothetical protein [Deltaproteobacteria bacterium]